MYHFRWRRIHAEYVDGLFREARQSTRRSSWVLDKDQFERLFRQRGSKIRIRCEDILFLEGYGDYVKIHRVNGKLLSGEPEGLKRISTRKLLSRPSFPYRCTVTH